MKPLSIECPNLTCIINQSWPEWCDYDKKKDTNTILKLGIKSNRQWVGNNDESK